MYYCQLCKNQVVLYKKTGIITIGMGTVSPDASLTQRRRKWLPQRHEGTKDSFIIIPLVLPWCLCVLVAIYMGVVNDRWRNGFLLSTDKQDQQGQEND